MAEGKDNKETDSSYAFELLRAYPIVRSFIFKKPLKKSFSDTLFELFAKR